MLKTTKVDLAKVNATLMREREKMLKSGLSLPYLENGEVKHETLKSPKPKAKEFA